MSPGCLAITLQQEVRFSYEMKLEERAHAVVLPIHRREAEANPYDAAASGPAGSVANNLGVIYVEQGRWQEAIDCLNEAQGHYRKVVDLFGPVGDRLRKLVAVVLYNSSLLLWRLGDADQAWEFWRLAMDELDSMPSTNTDDAAELVASALSDLASAMRQPV